MLLTDLALLPYRTVRLAVGSVGVVDRFVDESGNDPFSDLAAAIREGLRDLDAVREHMARPGRHLLRLDDHVEVLLAEVAASADGLTEGAETLTGAAVSLDGTGRRVVAEAADLDANAEALEGSLEEVADVMEPLQPAAEKVGKIARRFSRD